jgi:hypothetical protein
MPVRCTLPGERISREPSYVRGEMSHPPAPQLDEPPQPCRAIPGIARRGWRSDVLCASIANSAVAFHGRQVAVCRIHYAMYERWGLDAEQRAIELWSWKVVPGA